MRGEYNPSRSISQSEMELPPRARRIPQGYVPYDTYFGTTSACAENTRGPATCLPYSRNYLRVRGEYLCKRDAISSIAELPPRARRIHLGRDPKMRERGTTSACAENTHRVGAPWSHGGNYLRVRGEYIPHTRQTAFYTELPPRARRIPLKANKDETGKGTTSACAENTSALSWHGWGDWNYLRVRGEYK